MSEEKCYFEWTDCGQLFVYLPEPKEKKESFRVVPVTFKYENCDCNKKPWVRWHTTSVKVTNVPGQFVILETDKTNAVMVGENVTYLRPSGRISEWTEKIFTACINSIEITSATEKTWQCKKGTQKYFKAGINTEFILPFILAHLSDKESCPVVGYYKHTDQQALITQEQLASFFNTEENGPKYSAMLLEANDHVSTVVFDGENKKYSSFDTMGINDPGNHKRLLDSCVESLQVERIQTCSGCGFFTTKFVLTLLNGQDLKKALEQTRNLVTSFKEKETEVNAKTQEVDAASAKGQKSGAKGQKTDDRLEGVKDLLIKGFGLSESISRATLKCKKECVNGTLREMEDSEGNLYSSPDIERPVNIGAPSKPIVQIDSGDPATVSLVEVKMRKLEKDSSRDKTKQVSCNTSDK